MEKTWDEFWATGKVTDYLAYRDVVSDSRKNRRRNRQGQWDKQWS